MLLNGVNISTYKAKLLTKSIQTSEIVIYDDWLKKSILPLYIGKQETFKSIKMQLLISDTTIQNCLMDISTIVTQLKRCTIKFDDVDFYYDCTLTTKEHTELIVSGYFILDVELKAGYGYTAEVTETMNGVLTKDITVLGNLPSPAKVTITVPINTISRTITGFEAPMVINDLLANVPVIIDGETCTILQNGSNKFADVDLLAFPTLQPGTHTISVDNASCIITIKYKPKYL